MTSKNRMVIIVDSLRYDCAELLDLKPCWILPTIALGAHTADVFRELDLWKWEGPKIMFTGGWPLKLSWPDVQLHSCLYPLAEKQDEISNIIAKSNSLNKDNVLLIVHDYFVHNYFEQVDDGKSPRKWEGKVPEHAFAAYRTRCIKTGQMIRELLKYTMNWDVYVTADHGECFCEDGISYHHGGLANKSPLVYQIPIIGIKNAPILSFTQLFRTQKQCTA